MSDYHLVTHKDCLDGAGAAAVFIRCGGSPHNVHFVPAGESSVDPAVVDLLGRGVPIHVVDVCPSEGVLRTLIGRGNWIWDHHKSSEARMARMASPRCITNSNRCGCKLYMEWLRVDAMFPPGGRLLGFIDAIESVDLYQKDNPNYRDGEYLADIMSAGVSMSPLLQTMDQLEFAIVLAQEDAYELLWSKFYEGVARTARQMCRTYTQQAVERAWITQLVEPFDGGNTITVAIASAPGWWRSEVGNALLDIPDVDLGAVVDTTAGIVSLRSRSPKVDCSRIAEGYGGGGHARAAGFPIDRADFLSKAFS